MTPEQAREILADLQYTPGADSTHGRPADQRAAIKAACRVLATTPSAPAPAPAPAVDAAEE